ncbi:serine hydrolase domain-containing protein [Membranihabitans maritimus]|uniref:serine hydrolase domain-containing protein n=1 Tax=Membranihabitans maritimus TaxID=2904244 RepID=UPI001F340BBA
MKKIIILIFLLPISFLLIGQPDQPAKHNQLDTFSGISNAQSKLIFEKTKNLPEKSQVAFAIIRNGDISFYGIERSNDSIINCNNANNLFEIGSITKVFTCSVLANLVLNEQLNLDDSINSFLDFPLNNNIQITFKELANHTSGLPRLPSNLNLFKVDPANPYKEYNEEKLIHYLKEEMSLSHSPGSHYEYSNLGVGLLGYILSQIENTTYEFLLHSKIFSKYGMDKSSTIRVEASDLVKGLNQRGEVVSNWDMSVLSGAGGILSTVSDLAKFAIAQFDPVNTELALTRVNTFRQSENMEIALGWASIKTDSGNEWYWHNGGTGGYTSSMILDVDNKNGIIVLSNVSAFSPQTGKIGELSHELMAALAE